jgi:hypothetical protein
MAINGHAALMEFKRGEVLIFLNRKPWGKAPRQNTTILKEKGNKYLQQAQPEVRLTEKRENRPKGQKSQQSKAKQTITRLAARARWKDEDLL